MTTYTYGSPNPFPVADEFRLSDLELAAGKQLPCDFWVVEDLTVLTDGSTENLGRHTPQCPAIPGYLNIGVVTDAEGNCWCVRRCLGGGLWWKRCE